MCNRLYRISDWLRRRCSPNERFSTRSQGRLGEDLAHRFLRDRGCRVVARNWRAHSGHGEIDLVVWHQESLAFVEVKTRSTEDYGAPETAVDEEKRAALARTAREYSRRSGIEWDRTRFDIVSVVLGKPIRIDWQRDAFR